LEPVIEACRAGPKLDLYALYMMNIGALARLRRGDRVGAETLEREIAGRRETDADDPRLCYVNLLNLSRLRRRAGDHAEARALQRDAFETSAGVANPWESFHFEVLEALAARSLGEDERPSWLRASLLWLAEPVRESVPDRVVRTLLGSQAPSSSEKMVERIGEFLTERLDTLGFVRAKTALTFARLRARQTADAVLMTPFGNLAWATAPSPPSMPSAVCDELAAKVSAALIDVGPARPGTSVFVDLARGLGIEKGPSAALDLLLRTGAHAAYAPGTATHFKDDVLERIWRDTRLSVGPGVAGFEKRGSGMLVQFHRHRPALLLASVAGQLAGAAREAPRLGEFAAELCDDRRTVFDLESQGIVLLTWEESTCIEAGIKLPSRAISATH